METWKAVLGFEGLYEVSDLGNVRRIAGSKFYKLSAPRILKPHPLGKGYLKVTLCKDGNNKYRGVHRIVADAFLGATAGLEPNHKNGDKKDNRLDNLELVTHGQNLRHAHRTLRVKAGNHRGCNNGFAKLTELDIHKIRELAGSGVIYRVIAPQFGIVENTVYNIVNRRAWKHV